MIEPRMLALVPREDKDALQDWVRQHMEWHVRIYTEAVKQGFKRYDAYATLRDMDDLEGWAYFHFLEHQNIAHSLGVSQPPDLTEIDPQDDISWVSWHEAHAEVHTDLRSALGIL